MLRISQPRIISFVRLLGKLGIFRPLLEYCVLWWTNLPWRGCGHRSEGPDLTSGIVTKTRYEIGTGVPRQDSLRRHEFLPLQGSFQLPRAALQ